MSVTTTTVAPLAGIKPLGERLRDTDYALEPFKRWELLTFLVWIPLMLVVARLGFSLLIIVHKGQHMSLRRELIEKDNKAVCISFAGYVFGVGLCTYGALSSYEADSLTKMWQTFVWSIIGFVLLNVSEFVNDKVLHFKINYFDEVTDHANVAVGMVHAAVYISTGAIIRFVIAGNVSAWGWALLSTIILWGVTQVFFVAIVHLYDFVTPSVDIQEELLKDNRAVGMSVAGGMVAYAILIQSPIAKSESIVALAIWCAIGLVVMVIFKFLSNKFLIRNRLIANNKSLPCWAASLVESSFLMSFAMAMGNFINQFRCGIDPRPWKDRITDIPFAMSIFRWYNLIFLVCILAIMLIARLISQYYDFFMACKYKAAPFDVMMRFLRVRRRDEAVELANQLEADPYLKMEYTKLFESSDEATLAMRQLSGEYAPIVHAADLDEANASAEGKAMMGGDPSVIRSTNDANHQHEYGQEMQPPTLTAEESAALGNLQYSGSGNAGAHPPQREVYSIARCVEFGGYLIGIAFVMRGALGASVDPSENFGSVIGYFFLWSCLGLVGLVIGFVIVRYVLWRSLFEDSRENPAIGVLAFGAYTASGMIVGSCLGGMSFGDGTVNANNESYEWGDDIATVAIFFVIGQGLLLITGFIFQFITKYNDIEEVRQRNMAVATTGCMNWIAFGICTSAPIFNSDSVLNVFLFYIIAVVLLQIIRLLTNFVIVGGGRLDKEIAEDKNWGASLVEGASAITTALCLTTFMADTCALNGVTTYGYDNK